MISVTAMYLFGTLALTATADAKKVKPQEWWEAASSDAKCEACRMIVDNGMLCIERSFEKQHKKQNTTWAQTKLEIKLSPFRYDLCKKKHLEEYIDGVEDRQGENQKLYSLWENESGNNAEDLEAACKHMIRTQDLWEGLVTPFSKIDWKGFHPFTGTKEKIGFIPKGNFKKFISKIYQPVCVDNLKLCNEEEGAAMYGHVKQPKVADKSVKEVEDAVIDKSPNSKPVDGDKLKAGAFGKSELRI